MIHYRCLIRLDITRFFDATVIDVNNSFQNVFSIGWFLIKLNFAFSKNQSEFLIVTNLRPFF